MVNAMAVLSVVDGLVNRGDSNGGDGAETKQAAGRSQGNDTPNGVEEEVRRLVEFQETNNPSPESRQAYYSETVTLAASGGRATARITPGDGMILKLDKVLFDRRNSHDYTFIVGGRTFSEAHEFDPDPPITLYHGDQIVAIAENQSSSNSEIDFVFKGWEEEA